eukprot:m.130795 g.130795  ORF g.130795 m.130795 type:complete len:444 (+) comp9473_c0_seq5:3561-4892(+)
MRCVLCSLPAVAVIVVVAIICATGSDAGPNPMYLHLMKDQVANGAVCLDGTPAGFYFAPANDPAANTRWQIYFEGGGWCYDEMDCWGRSKTNLGSSNNWGNKSEMGGLMDSDCTANPSFCTWNRVELAYCDGNSFSGNRDDPISVNGDKIFFRGRRIIDAVIQTLMGLGLSNASEVMLTGCSAGGLATYLHADYVHGVLQSKIPSLQVFKALSISGFFLLHNTVEGKPVYPSEMAYIYQLANSTHGLNADCIASKPSFLQWQCNFAQESYPHITTPFFVLNSALDSWQTGCIYTSEYVAANSTENGHCGAAPGWSSCSGNPDSCSPSQITRMVSYETDFTATISAIPTFTNAGNGAFIYSCHTHCAGQSSAFNKFSINNVTMQEAITKWWNSDTNTPASENTHLPCSYNEDKSPYDCNPSCVGEGVERISDPALMHTIGSTKV